jgi:surface antigen
MNQISIVFYSKKYLTVAITISAFVLFLPLIGILSLGRSGLSFLYHSSSESDAVSKGFYEGPELTSDTYAYGNCTYWVYLERYDANDPISTKWGDAKTWASNAQKDGYIVNHSPTINSIFQSSAGEYGHVAYVIKVDQASFTISEMNYRAFNVIDEREIPLDKAASYYFIHDKQY